MSTVKPPQMLDVCVDTGVAKAESSALKLFVLAILAGAFIAFAGAGSNMAAFNLLADPGTYGLGRMVAGSVFTAGLIMVVLAGGELFTGNVLIIASVADRKTTVGKLLRNWGIVYVGNFIGAVFIAFMCFYGGQFAGGEGVLGAITVKIAAGKVTMPFMKAFAMGILCNWLVSLGVWMSYSSTEVVGKIFAMFFPIWVFVTCGFEHCIANMYYIPAGIFAKADFGALSGVSAEALDALNWAGMIDNLIPVTLGNIVGAGIFVALAYWISFRKAK